MRVGLSDDKKIVINIKTASRDTREKVDGKPNDNYGKMKYETVETVDVFDATPAEVKEAVLRGLNSASAKK